MSGAEEGNAIDSHANDSEDELRRQDHKNKIDDIIKTRKYRKHELQSICSKNGLDSKGKLAELKDRLYNKIDVNINVLEVAPPKGGRRGVGARQTSTEVPDEDGEAILNLLNIVPLRQRRRLAAGATNEEQIDAVTNEEQIGNVLEDVQGSEHEQKIDAVNTAANDAEQQMDAAKKKKRAAQKASKLARDEMRMRIDQLETLVTEMRDNSENAASESADATAQSPFDAILTMIERMKTLYAAAPRAPRNQYKGSIAFISDNNKRYKQYENVFARLKRDVYELSKQTRSPMIIAGANGAAYGRVASSEADMWMSDMMIQTDAEISQQIYDAWNDSMTYYADNWREMQDNADENMVQVRVTRVLQAANIENKEEVREMARNLNLNFICDALDASNGAQQLSNNRNQHHNINNRPNRKHEMDADDGGDEDEDENEEETEEETE